MKGGSEDVRLVQAAQRCQAQRCQAQRCLARPPLCAASTGTEQSREAGAGAEGGVRGRKVPHLRCSEMIATPPTAAFFGALSASAPARRR